MKNLLNKNVDYDKLEESHARGKKYDAWWGTSSTEDHTIDGIWPWDRADHILKKYIGKFVNDAFSEYCEQVPKYQQQYFWKQILLHHEIASRWRRVQFKIDDQNCIQLAKPELDKKRPILYSKDYKIIYRLKPEIQLNKKDDVIGLIFEDRELDTYDYNYLVKNNFPQAKYYDEVEIGEKQVFESVKDPRFIRAKAEQLKERKRDYKLWKKAQQEKEYNLLSKKEIEEKKERAEDNIKIVAKGFDLETSFRTEKQINPETIAKNQGF